MFRMLPMSTRPYVSLVLVNVDPSFANSAIEVSKILITERGKCFHGNFYSVRKVNPSFGVFGHWGVEVVEMEIAQSRNLFPESYKPVHQRL